MNLLDRMLEHNAWALRALIERCGALTPGQFTQRFDLGPGSLHDTLLHTIGAMKRWSDRVSDREVRPSIEEDRATRTSEQLLAALEEAHRELTDAAGRISREDRLDEMMLPQIRGWENPRPFTRAAAILHVITHGVHHRAQCLNMLRQLGVSDLPELDPIECELRRAES